MKFYENQEYMCGLTECGCFYPLEPVNNHIYSLNIHKFSEILEILLQTCYNNPIIPDGGNHSNRKSGEEHGRQKKGPGYIKVSDMRFREFLPVSARKEI